MWAQCVATVKMAPKSTAKEEGGKNLLEMKTGNRYHNMSKDQKWNLLETRPARRAVVHYPIPHSELENKAENTA